MKKRLIDIFGISLIATSVLAGSLDLSYPNIVPSANDQRTEITQKYSDRDSSKIISFIQPSQGFSAELIAEIPQEATNELTIGDIDDNGENELITGTSPDSRLYIHRYNKETKKFKTELLEEKLAGRECAIGQLNNLLITDINQDGTNEIVAMTDQMKLNPYFEVTNMKFWVFSKRKEGWYKNSIEVKSPSYWTHRLAALDVDNDGIQEIFSTHCGHGEIFRYKFSRDLSQIVYEEVKKLWAAGENLEIADIFNTGQKKLIAVQGDDKYNTAVKIYGFTREGLTKWPEVCIDSYKERKFWDATTCTGDIDNDGENEMVVGWPFPRTGRELTLIIYKFDKDGNIILEKPLVEFSKDFDEGYLEAMMRIGKLGDDKRNKFYISRNRSGIYEFSLESDGNWRYNRIVNPTSLKTGRIIIGDVDNDGFNELIFSSNKPDADTNKSYIFMLRKGGNKN